nr:ankyrin repeat domain-containing protein [Candidatus Phycorickettsia trachydisci]
MTNSPKNSDSPLHLSIKYNSDIDIIKSLLDKGADINVEDAYEKASLHITVSANYESSLHSLMQEDDGSEINTHTIGDGPSAF